jgi:AcrR family transcriptional regulator
MDGQAGRTDPRIVRSKIALKNAFLELLSKKSFHSISITDIVKTAGYNRGTFYANYETKEALLDDVILQSTQDLFRSFRASYKTEQTIRLDRLQADSVRIFEYVYENRGLYSLLASSGVAPIFKDKMFVNLKTMLSEDIETTTGSVDSELIEIFWISGLIGLIFYWVQSGFSYAPAYIQEQLVKIVNQFPWEMRFKTRK